MAQREWNLTAKQKQVAELLAIGDPDNNFQTYSKVEICEKTSTPRSTLYVWLQNEEFVAYKEYLSDLYIRSHIAEVDRKLINQLLSTSTLNSRLAEIFYKRTGKLKMDGKIEVDVNETRDISEKSLEELFADVQRLRDEAKSE